MSKNNGFQQIVEDTAAARRGIMPDHLVAEYGNTGVPDAAKFGVGTSTRQGAADAQNARRNAQPGSYDHRK